MCVQGHLTNHQLPTVELLPQRLTSRMATNDTEREASAEERARGAQRRPLLGLVVASRGDEGEDARTATEANGLRSAIIAGSRQPLRAKTAEGDDERRPRAGVRTGIGRRKEGAIVALAKRVTRSVSRAEHTVVGAPWTRQRAKEEAARKCAEERAREAEENDSAHTTRASVERRDGRDSEGSGEETEPAAEWVEKH